MFVFLWTFLLRNVRLKYVDRRAPAADYAVGPAPEDTLSPVEFCQVFGKLASSAARGCGLEHIDEA